MRKRYHSRSGMTTLAELNVTPMLDLAFVLLIIFMITAPLLAESKDLIIPTSKARGDALDPDQIYTIGINKSGKVSLEGNPVSDNELVQMLQQLRNEKPELGAVIQAHRTIPIQEVVHVMDLLKSIDVTDVAILTKPSDT
ncbi:MAG: biopolymer transporter ExbD [Verrucomicrobiota bacterium]